MNPHRLPRILPRPPSADPSAIDRTRIPLATAVVAALLAATPVHASLDLKKNWYLDRARSNTKIGNHKAAIEAYEKVLEEDPGNTEAMRSLGLAYESQGLKDKAVEQYDHYLEKNPTDADIAFRQAEALEWSRYSYRKEDALKYYKMGLKQKSDNKRRLRYARLLASNQGTSREAIEQYNIVLKSNPRSGEAHRGLAQALAWNGQNDQAVYHSHLACEYGACGGDLNRLNSDLSKGREPQLGGGFLYLTQPGNGFEQSGFELSAQGRMELGAFATGRLRAGMESWKGGSASASGGFFGLGGQYRLTETQSLNLDIGYHSIAPERTGTTTTTTTTATGKGNSLATSTGSSTNAADARNFTARAEYRTQDGDFRFAPGFERSIRTDSYLSRVGSGGSASAETGAARSNQFYADLTWDHGVTDYGLKPFFGWVSSAGAIKSNPMVGIDGQARYRFAESSSSSFWIGDSMQVSHYSEDQSATAGPNAGGYFSPKVFVGQNPHLGARFAIGDRQTAELQGGPSLQYVKDTSLNGSFQLGANVSASYAAQFARRLQWRAGAGYQKVADKFNQLQVDNQLTYTF